MLSCLIAGVISFFFTALLTISGVGAAFILIPVFVALGVEVHQAMATALLLNALAMSFASALFIRKGLVAFRVAIPMLIGGSVSSPVCAYLSNYIDRTPLLWMFAAFCIIAGGMMLLFTPKAREEERSRTRWIQIGLVIGFMAGIGGGLLGVGGGNLLVAVLVLLGLGPKQASASTAFIVIFLCLAGFLGHASTGLADPALTLTAAVSAVAGALLGAWLMMEKLASGQVKRIVGVVLILIAGKVVFDLLF
jgi:uncharacterized membrane protein YfcA